METKKQPIRFDLNAFNCMGKIEAAEYVNNCIESVENYHMGVIMERDRAIFKMKSAMIEMQTELKRVRNEK